MKIFGIVVAAIVALIAALAIFMYVSVTQFPKWMAEYGPELPIDARAKAQAAEATLVAAKGDYDRWVALSDAVYWRSTQPNPDGVAAVASELLGIAERYKNDWNYGNAIHKANSALGRLALRGGDKESARKYLLASARSKGSPQMNSFGPNMGFAKEMIEAGERETVLEYFALCRQFWEMGQGQLDVWTRMIGDGKAPVFGANLLY